MVGEFTADGGILDASPGFTTEALCWRGCVQGPTEDDSGYFMATKDVVAGAKIIDSSDVFSSWVQVADVNGQGFAEAYPDAPLYNHNA